MGNGLGMQTFMKICSVVMKLNHFLPSPFSQTAYTHIPDTKSVIVCSIWYYGDDLPYRRINKATTRPMDR